ncbi:hypothetical protein, partial [Streptomyces mirabilis]
MAAIEHALPDAAVFLDMGECFSPAASCCQGTCPLGEEDPPQPGTNLLAILGVRGEVGGYGDFLDLSRGLGADSVKECQEALAAVVVLPGAELEAREIDERFEGSNR